MCGVSQGTVLGPNLFIVYINIVRSLEKCKIQLFADDTLVYLIGQDVVEVKFNTISNTNHNGIFINGHRIEQVDQYLGVIVDEYLTFSKHAE